MKLVIRATLCISGYIMVSWGNGRNLPNIHIIQGLVPALPLQASFILLFGTEKEDE